MARRCFARNGLILSFALVALFALNCWAGAGGSVSGTVKDVSKAVVTNATVKATNLETGVQHQVATNGQGFYSFPDLAIGRYNITIQKTGFKPYQRTGIVIDADSALGVDAVLEIGVRAQAVTVNENAVHVETSDTQIGEVISGTKMAAVPLDGRSYTDLLSLQPGVVPATSLTSNTQQDVGVSALSPSGGLNPGTISINGQREFSNAFIVNGSDAEEDVNSGAAIIPNLDSIAEFRILTSDFDAEYGGHSGGQINVVTKSGTNQFHGDGFEFLRNTNLDARNYFSPTRGTFDQNQFGGTFGGPIRRSKLFFFADYQGTRSTQGVDTGQIPVPSLSDRSGNLFDLASLLTGTVTGQHWANLLSQKLRYSVFPGEPYYTAGCTNLLQCVLPNAAIPTSAWSTPAKNLLQYIPQPNVGADTFATSDSNETLRDDKGAYRLDYNSHWGLLSAYYFLDDYTLNNPYPVAQSGASVPGFNALYLGRAQLLSLSDTKTLGSTAVNEFHFSYMRDHNDLGKPVGGLGVSLASQGFVTGTGTPGIVPLDPQGEGVENLVFNAFSIGTNANELKQVNNTFQWLDNFSKVAGRHTMKFGLEFHYDQVNTNPIAQFNGNFLFTGSETGSDFADFLLGIPSQYNQSQLQPFYGRNQYWGLYGQDSWRVRSNLTLNYGLRWDRIEPWYEKNNGVSTFEPGNSSVVFPGAPAGILFPTDPGVSRTLAPPGNLDFAPRVGLAYSPEAKDDTLLSKILGGPGKTSIRAGFGMYYTAIEALTVGILAANPPFGSTYSSPSPPLFATPFITASTGQVQAQPFPVALVTGKASSSNPDPNVNWSQYEPISGIPGYASTNRIPYVEEYTLSVQRQFRANTVLSASYVGTQAHRLLVMIEANPGDPALCLSLSQPSAVAPGSATCGPFRESNVFTTTSGQVINGTRGPLGPNFGSDTNQATIGKSNYNALELSLRHTSRRLELSAGYTYSKSMDESSNLGEEVNPINPALSYALSSFDITHNFVVSYNYKIPFETLFHTSNRWTEGWELSGITHFSSGLPVTLINYGDNSLLGAEPNGINNYGVDEPDYTDGPLDLNHNPRNGRPYFDASQFSENTLGTPGTAKRRFFYGPGMNNYDMALLKNVRLTESKSLQFRLEGFNIFNHAQFFGPQSVDGNIDSSNFGQVVSASAPRLVQLGAKFLF
ncbi:MAG TPA: carboxypeptidase regulatory-like domain-containing protein [Terriglobales bacterium]|nr:carboxypeptidase regulatory-like domain-containing protein [Terriglobales bacterium]